MVNAIEITRNRNFDTDADIALYETADETRWIVVGQDVIQMPCTYTVDRFEDDVEDMTSGHWTPRDAAAEHTVLSYIDWDETHYEDQTLLAEHTIVRDRLLASDYSQDGLQITLHRVGTSRVVIDRISEYNEDVTVICSIYDVEQYIDDRSSYAVWSGNGDVLLDLTKISDVEDEQEAAQALHDEIAADGELEYVIYQISSVTQQLLEQGYSVQMDYPPVTVTCN